MKSLTLLFFLAFTCAYAQTDQKADDNQSSQDPQQQGQHGGNGQHGGGHGHHHHYKEDKGPNKGKMVMDREHKEYKVEMVTPSHHKNIEVAYFLYDTLVRPVDVKGFSGTVKYYFGTVEYLEANLLSSNGPNKFVTKMEDWQEYKKAVVTLKSGTTTYTFTILHEVPVAHNQGGGQQQGGGGHHGHHGGGGGGGMGGGGMGGGGMGGGGMGGGGMGGGGMGGGGMGGGGMGGGGMQGGGMQGGGMGGGGNGGGGGGIQGW